MTPDDPVHPARDHRASSLAKVQSIMHSFVTSRGWYESHSDKPQTPRNLATSIALEAGEIVECFQWGEAADSAEVGAELADVVLYAAQLANVLDIDLGEAVARKVAHNEIRFAAVVPEPWPRLAG